MRHEPVEIVVKPCQDEPSLEPQIDDPAFERRAQWPIAEVDETNSRRGPADDRRSVDKDPNPFSGLSRPAAPTICAGG